MKKFPPFYASSKQVSWYIYHLCDNACWGLLLLFFFNYNRFFLQVLDWLSSWRKATSLPDQTIYQTTVHKLKVGILSIIMWTEDCYFTGCKDHIRVADKVLFQPIVYLYFLLFLFKNNCWGTSIEYLQENYFYLDTHLSYATNIRRQFAWNPSQHST